MSCRIRAAIAGQGRSGYKIHARCLSKLTHLYEIAAVADLIEDRQHDGRETLGAKAVSDYRELFDIGGFDLFINALPSPLHVPATIEALQRGYNVVCEKPMAATVAEFDSMVDAAKANDRMLAPFQNNRLQPFFENIQKVIASGVLGKIVHIRSVWGGFNRRWDWQTLKKNMGGTLFNTGPHAIDQALELFGTDCEPEVFCRMGFNHALGGDADDISSVTLYDPANNAPTIEIHITSFHAFRDQYTYTICGTNGTMLAGATEAKWKYFDPKDAPDQKFWDNWSVDRSYPTEELPWQQDSWTLEADQQKNAVGYTLKSMPSGVTKFYMNIHDVLNNKAEPIITTNQVRRQIKVLETCHAYAGEAATD